MATFIETACLLAAMNDDTEQLDRLLAQLSYQELYEFGNAVARLSMKVNIAFEKKRDVLVRDSDRT